MMTSSDKMVHLDTYTQRKNMKKQKNQYQCMMAGDRLQGQCDVLIYDRYQRIAEIFYLQFCMEGVTQYQHFDEMEKALWVKKTDAVEITYEQAMLLLGDAVRLNYKHQEKTEWIELHSSLHIQRIWQKEYYDAIRCDLSWLLDIRDPIEFVEIYLKAISNKDAVLLYDLTAESAKQYDSRDVYVYSWNHILEEFEDIFVLEMRTNFVERREQTYLNVYVVLSGRQLGMEIVGVDMCLQLIEENGWLRLFLDEVLEVHCIKEGEN